AAVRIANIDSGRRPKNLVERNSKRKAESKRRSKAREEEEHRVIEGLLCLTLAPAANVSH
ncbi:hypothetical protein GGF42_009041, partial [Coemansia sp. RSA 2424]